MILYENEFEKWNGSRILRKKLTCTVVTATRVLRTHRVVQGCLKMPMIPPLIFVVIMIWTVVPVGAQVERRSPEDSRTLELVDQLKEIIQKAEKSRSINPAILNQLRDLVNRYDWPWRVKLLFDDFSDGDYILNPAWSVSRGDFRVVRGSGLQTIVGPRSSLSPPESPNKGESSPIDIIGGILRGVADPKGIMRQFRAGLPTAEISIPVVIGNAFAIRVRLVSRDRTQDGARLEFGPFRGSDRYWGYRLVYNPGQRPSFEILRLFPGRSTIVEKLDAAIELEDGMVHSLEWQRDSEGLIQVFLDGREIMRTIDRGSDFFDGFTILNGGGDYKFERIEIFGTAR